jgi:hypothetical protein
MIKKIRNIILFVVLTTPSFSQTGGDNVYEFLNLTHSALVSALGGTNVSVSCNNLNLAYHNPALLNADMGKSVALNYVKYFAGINYGMAMYSKSYEGVGSFAAGITYLNYGSFTEADAAGTITGSFGASEYAFQLLYSRCIDSSFNIGVNIKPVLSHLEDYTSIGIAADIGASWHNRTNLFSAGIVIKNAGFQITTYAGEPGQNLPFEIQAGVTQRLAHAPFRFSLTYRHLEKFDLTHQYASATAPPATEATGEDFRENMLRHLIVGAEIIPHKNFYLCAGYNYQRRSELQIESKVSMVGFSWGFGINTTWADIEFGRATYHLAGSSSDISLIFRPEKIYRRNRNQ